MGGTSDGSCNANVLRIAENDAISWLKLMNALVVDIRDKLGCGVGDGKIVGVIAAGCSTGAGALLRTYRKPKRKIPTARIAVISIRIFLLPIGPSAFLGGTGGIGGIPGITGAVSGGDVTGAATAG
jgi:hypothetical protein